MIDFICINDGYQFIVDSRVFNDNVVSKVTYVLSEEFLVYQRKIRSEKQVIALKEKKDVLSNNKPELIEEKINQLLIDYKNRDIINKETKDIRNILYVKAFANNEDFEDYNLIK
jgi:His-Xaa-Ser system protein HxsD